MRIKNLFYILLAATFVFASCSKTTEEVRPTPEPQPEPQPDPEVEYLYDMTMQNATRIPNYILEIAFEDGRVLPDHLFAIGFNNEDGVLEFAVALMGNEGDAVLQAGSYTTENGGFVIYPEFEQSVDDNDKEYLLARGDVKVEGDVNGYTFDILLEDTEGNLFHFTYEGQVENMRPDEVATSVEYEALYCYGECFGYTYGNTYNYYLHLTDFEMKDGVPVGGTKYYSLDLYSIKGELDGEGNMIIPAGEYTLDPDGTMAEWTISPAYSWLVPIGYSNTQFSEAKLVVTESGATLTALIKDVVHTVTYNGQLKLPAPHVEFEALDVSGVSYGYNYGETYNYYLFLSDIGFNEGYAQAGGTYYQLDLYSIEGELDGEGNVLIPTGVYTLDTYSTLAEWSICAAYSYYFVVNDEGTAYEVPKTALTDGTLVVEEDKATLTATIDDTLHTVTYNGRLKLPVYTESTATTTSTFSTNGMSMTLAKGR